jgi:hypothetical protein
MSLLEQICASGGDQAVIDSLELSCAIWTGPQRLVQGYQDLSLGFGNGSYATFRAVPIGIVLPARNNSPNQKLTFAIDNVLGEAQRLVDQALAANVPIKMTFRRYVESNLYGPAEVPFVATVLGGGIKGTTIQLSAGFQNLLDYKYPRDTYDLDNTPDLAYV